MANLTPQEEEELKHSIWQDAEDVFVWWCLWREICFDRNPDGSTITLYTAPSFFNTLDRLLTDQVMLGLSRLTDKSKHSRTLQYIIGDKALNIDSISLDNQIKQFNKQCERVTQYRNENIGHTSLSPKQTQKPRVCDVEKAIQSMIEIVKIITNRQLSFTKNKGGGGQLRSVLSDALRWREFHRQLVSREDGKKSPALSGKEIIEIFKCILDSNPCEQPQ